MIIKSNKNVYKNYFGEDGISKIYAGENLVFGPIDYANEFFGIQGLQNANINFTTNKTINLKYSFDKKNWVSWDYVNNSISLPAGQIVYFKGNNSNGFTTSSYDYSNFIISRGQVNLLGNIKSLISETNFKNVLLPNSAFSYIFKNNSLLISTKKLILNTTSNFCYQGMFQGCTSLIDAPELSSTSLSSHCYQYMFQGCTSLTEAPELPAKYITEFAYARMFQGCTSLTEAPELPGESLYNSCYHSMFRDCTSLTKAPNKIGIFAQANQEQCVSMFQGCTSLTEAPELPANILLNSCYNYMFKNCEKLNYIKAMFTTIPSHNYMWEWVSNVSSPGTFVMNAAAEWDPEEYRGVNGIPEGWTVIKE